MYTILCYSTKWCLYIYIYNKLRFTTIVNLVLANDTIFTELQNYGYQFVFINAQPKGISRKSINTLRYVIVRTLLKTSQITYQ